MATDKTTKMLKILYADLYEYHDRYAQIQQEIMEIESEQKRMRDLIKYCQTGDSRYITVSLFSLERHRGKR